MTEGLDASGSVVRRWQLAAALKAQREQAGLTQEQAIDRLGAGPGRWSRSKLSRVENRKHHLKPREVEQLLDAYGATDAGTRNEFVQLAGGSRDQGWWDSLGKTFTDNMRTLMSLESGLVALRDFQNQLVHGLLQTGDYTRALLLSGNPVPFSAAELERGVAARMARQQIIASASRCCPSMRAPALAWEGRSPCSRCPPRCRTSGTPKAGRAPSSLRTGTGCETGCCASTS